MNNYDYENLEVIEKNLDKEKFPEKTFRILECEFNIRKVNISEESRKICTKLLLG